MTWKAQAGVSDKAAGSATSADPKTCANGMELAGIEPASPRCDRGVLPLYDSPVSNPAKRTALALVFARRRLILRNPQWNSTFFRQNPCFHVTFRSGNALGELNSTFWRPNVALVCCVLCFLCELLSVCLRMPIFRSRLCCPSRHVSWGRVCRPGSRWASAR